MKKRKQATSSIANLARGRFKKPVTEAVKRLRRTYKRKGKYVIDVGTSMHQSYSRQNPSAAMKSKLDEFHDKVVLAIARIDKARPKKDIRTIKEVTMLLQFTLKFAAQHKCTLTVACEEVAATFRWDNKLIFKTVNNYLTGNNDQPILEAKQMRGRASEIFQQRYGDQFKVLKAHHAAEILDYVSLSNSERGGMTTCGRIQAHLLEKFGKLFKKCTIQYCLSQRLRLKFSNVGKPKIIFTTAHRRAALILQKSR